MDNSNSAENGAKPRINRNFNQYRQPQPPRTRRVVRKLPPRVANSADRRHIYITTKSDFKAQQKRCEEVLNSGAKEIFLHCMGFAITRGLNLALSLIKNSDGALKYALNTSTLKLIDELHPLCEDDDISFRQRNNSALHIKIYSVNPFELNVPKLPALAPLPTPDPTEDGRHKQHQQYQNKKPQGRLQK